MLKNNKILITDNAVYLDPDIWGAKFWFVIESVLLSLDIFDIQSVENTFLFLSSLKHTIPCPTCRQHYQNYMQKNDIQDVFKSKKKLFFWIFKLQNQIKKRTNRKPFRNFTEYLDIVKKKFNLRDDELRF